jgi:hypothetical protein
MALRVVPGGRGGGESPRRRKATTLMDRYINALLKVLPASSRRQIAQRMSKELNLDISVAIVDNVLDYVREHAKTLNMEVHHAARGPNRSKTDRFYALPFERDGVSLTPAEKAAYAAGTFGTLSYGHTTLQRLSVMFAARANHADKRKDLQTLRSLSRRLDNFAADVGEVLEELQEGNGA